MFTCQTFHSYFFHPSLYLLYNIFLKNKINKLFKVLHSQFQDLWRMRRMFLCCLLPAYVSCHECLPSPPLVYLLKPQSQLFGASWIMHDPSANMKWNSCGSRPGSRSLLSPHPSRLLHGSEWPHTDTRSVFWRDRTSQESRNPHPECSTDSCARISGLSSPLLWPVAVSQRIKAILPARLPSILKLALRQLNKGK